MSTVKLTLSADANVVRKFKRFAKKRNTSVSALVGGFMESQIESEKKKVDVNNLSPITRSLSGIIKIPAGKTDRELIEDALDEKYGLNK